MLLEFFLRTFPSVPFQAGKLPGKCFIFASSHEGVFAVVALQLWNALPSQIRLAPTLMGVNAYLFTEPFDKLSGGDVLLLPQHCDIIRFTAAVVWVF